MECAGLNRSLPYLVALLILLLALHCTAQYRGPEVVRVGDKYYNKQEYLRYYYSYFQNIYYKEYVKQYAAAQAKKAAGLQPQPVPTAAPRPPSPQPQPQPPPPQVPQTMYYPSNYPTQITPSQMGQAPSIPFQQPVPSQPAPTSRFREMLDMMQTFKMMNNILNPPEPSSSTGRMPGGMRGLGGMGGTGMGGTGMGMSMGSLGGLNALAGMDGIGPLGALGAMGGGANPNMMAQQRCRMCTADKDRECMRLSCVPSTSFNPWW